MLGEWYTQTGFAVDPDGTYAATCSPDPVYLSAVITIYPCYWGHTRAQREEIIVHELSHCLTEELYQAAHDMTNGKLVTRDHLNQLRERLTQRITNAVFDW